MIMIKKVNILLKYIPKDNIIKQDEFIYAGVKLVSDKIGITQRNSNRNTKARWKMRIERKILKKTATRNVKRTITQQNEKDPKKTNAKQA